jgi:hypothetical protein
MFAGAVVDVKDMLKPCTDSKPIPMQLPEGWDSIVPELINVKNAHVITKRQWVAFYGIDHENLNS